MMTFITVIFLHFQYEFGKEGKTKYAVLLAVIYSSITMSVPTDHKLTFLAMMYVVIAMWLITLVSIYR